MAVAVEPVAVEGGLWCDDCTLPSGIEVLLAVTRFQTIVATTTRFGCTDCYGENVRRN